LMFFFFVYGVRRQAPIAVVTITDQFNLVTSIRLR